MGTPNEVAGAGWQEVPADICREELACWAARVPQPVAVTGSTGFLGSHLTGALVSAGVKPRLLVRDRARLLPELGSEVSVITGDLGNIAALAKLVDGCRTVLHLAGLVRAGRASAFDRANREGTENLIGVRNRVAPDASIVYVSSLAAVGPSATPEGKSPDQAAQPISAYGRSKLAGEAAVRNGGGRWVILRPPVIYGPRDIAVLQFFRMAARGLVLVPAPTGWITIAYVSDVVRAIFAAAGGGNWEEVLHLGEPRPYRMDELIALLARAGSVKARVLRVPGAVIRLVGMAGDALHAMGFHKVVLTSDKARELLACHWTSRTEESLRRLGLPGFVPFRMGAKATWRWYMMHGWVARARISDLV